MRAFSRYFEKTSIFDPDFWHFSNGHDGRILPLMVKSFNGKIEEPETFLYVPYLTHSNNIPLHYNASKSPAIENITNFGGHFHPEDQVLQR